MARRQLDALMVAGSRHFNRAVDKQLAPSARRLTAEYRAVKATLKPALAALRDAVGEPSMTRYRMRQSGAYAHLQAEARAALSAYASAVGREAQRQQAEGERVGQAIAMTTLADTMPGVKATTPPQFNPVAMAGVASIATLIARWAHDRVETLERFFDTAERSGFTVHWLLEQLTTYLIDSVLAEAIGAVETIGLYAIRDAVRGIYERNGVKEWIWSCARDRKTCASCWSLHGRRFPISQTLNDHPSGRCAPIPVTPTWAELGFGDGTDLTIGTGETYFSQLPRSQQIAIMGRARWQAWQDGLFAFSDLSGTGQIDGLGTVRVARSLRDLVGDSVARQYIRHTRGTS